MLLPDAAAASKCTGAGRPPWAERLSGEDASEVALLEPGYGPGSAWKAFAPGERKEEDMLGPERFTQPQCDAHWRPVPHFAEFEALFRMKAVDRRGRLPEIRSQHFGSTSRFSLVGLFAPLIQSARKRSGGAGDINDVLQVVKLLGSAGDEIQRVMLAQKCLYNRARPFQYFPELDPPFCPAHPSYPSGHATESHGLAFFLDAAMDVPNNPHRQERLQARQLAFRVAENREVAGVHFSSDTDAGIDLARRLVDEILAHALMKPRLAQLRQLFTPA